MCYGIEKWRNWHICSNLMQGVFLDPKSKINNKILYDVILMSKWRKSKIPIFRLQKMHMTSLWRHYFPIFSKLPFIFFLWGTITTPNLVLIWPRKAKLRRGGGVDNVLNRPGEIGLMLLLADLNNTYENDRPISGGGGGERYRVGNFHLSVTFWCKFSLSTSTCSNCFTVIPCLDSCSDVIRKVYFQFSTKIHSKYHYQFPF